MELKQETFDAIKAHVLNEYPKEAAGFIVEGGDFMPCANVAKDPLNFHSCDPVDFVKITKKSTILAHVHSHTNKFDRVLRKYDDYRHPSAMDMNSFIKTNETQYMPWGITATDGETVMPLVWMDTKAEIPLVGRKWFHGITDCYSLIRDYYKTHHNVVLQDYARDMSWWDKKRGSPGSNLYEEWLEAEGFYEIRSNEFLPGDGALIQIGGVICHAGVITSPTELLHHRMDHVSGYDNLYNWAHRIVKYVRHREINQK